MHQEPLDTNFSTTTSTLRLRRTLTSHHQGQKHTSQIVTCIAAVPGFGEREAAKLCPACKGQEVLRLLFSRAKLLQRVAVQGLFRNRTRASRQADKQTGERRTASVRPSNKPWITCRVRGRVRGRDKLLRKSCPKKSRLSLAYRALIFNEKEQSSSKVLSCAIVLVKSLRKQTVLTGVCGHSRPELARV